MRIAIAGAHGQIAGPLIDRLLDRGDEVVGLIRNPDHAQEISARGASPVVCDLERDGVEAVVTAIGGCDAVVFAAGAGAGSGAERKLTMDRDGAVKLLEAAAGASVGRYVMVSAVGAEDPPNDDEVFSVYLRAKAEADDAVRLSDRAWTIVRPGRLTDDPETDRVRLDTAPFRGEVTRADVAAVLAAVLAEPRSAGLVLYLNTGESSVAAALAGVLETD